MALVFADRVKETSTTTGTGIYSLAGAVTGFRTFFAGIGDGQSCHYCAEDGTNWEVGIGSISHATPDTLTRLTILASSNAGAAVNWSAGTRNLFCVCAAADTVPVNPSTCNGRLTLATATPVTTTDQTAKTTVFWTPYLGNGVAVYDGTAIWKYRTFAELSVAVPATTNTPFDIFVYDNAGSAALETLNWTSDTARATALVIQDGVWVKSGATTRRYLGTGRTTGSSGQCEDSLANRLLWNYYNRVDRTGYRSESTSHTYTTATFRAWNNSASAAQVAFVVGVLEDAISGHVQARMTVGAGAGLCTVTLGVNSTTASAFFDYIVSTATQTYVGVSSGRVMPAVGYNYACPLENGNATSVTFTDVATYIGLKG